MFRYIYFASALLLASAACARADVVDVPSAITQAVVYPDAARVTRAVKLTLKAGSQTIRLKDVVPVFDENSLSVAGSGTAVVKILGAGMKTEFLKDPSDGRVRELESRIQVVDDELAALQNEVVALEQKKAFLDSVRMFTGAQLPKDLVTKVPTADELKATMAFIEEGFKGYGDVRLGLVVKQREKGKERNVLNNELNQLRSAAGSQQRVLVVDLECLKAGEFSLEVAYTVTQVGWYPLYDARVEVEKGKADISAYAVLHQTTGEDWTDAALTLSTARPSVGGRMPELSSWYLNPYVAHNSYKKERRSWGGVDKMMGAAGSMESSLSSDSMMEAPAAAPVQAAEVSYAQVQSSGVALTYKAARPVTVKSDGSEVRVPLLAQALDVKFEYAATPKLSTYAYLKSEVVNNPADQLLAGRVNIFLDGTFVGNSDIAKTIAPGETFSLYLGVDEGVHLKRELIEQKSDDTLIGNIPSSVRKVSFIYKITVENFKPRPVTVKLFDQVPVAQDDKIKVVKAQASIKPDTEKYMDREGVYLWTLVLEPKAKKEITISYVVECPRDMRIEGL